MIIENNNSDKIVSFHDPHPGLAGCPVPLPEHLRLTANWLNGCTMSIGEAVQIITDTIDDAGIQRATLKVYDDWIGLQIETPESFIHSWRLIRFKA